MRGEIDPRARRDQRLDQPHLHLGWKAHETNITAAQWIVEFPKMRDRSTQTHRVLHIGKYFPPRYGGMETYLSDLMNVQQGLGMAVAAVTHHHKPGFRDTFGAEDFRKTDGREPHQIYRAARWFNVGVVPVSPLFAFTLVRAIAEFRPTILHFHHPNASAAWALLLPSARRIPWVATWHADILTPEASPAIKLGYHLYRPLERAQLARTQYVLATSERYRASSSCLTALGSRCEVMPLGLDKRRLPPKTQQTESSEGVGSHQDSIKILTVGRIATYKGYSHLLDALALLPEAALTMVISGSDAEITGLEKRIDALGLNSRVSLKKNLTDSELWDQYRACQVFCLPSTDKTEAFGMVLLEAQYFNRPIVACDISGSGVPWVASKNARFALAQPGNAQSLAAAIERVLAEETSIQMSAKMMVDPDTFNLEDQAKRLMDIYQQAGDALKNR